MQDFKWRSKAKVVALVHMITVALLLGGIIAVAIIGTLRVLEGVENRSIMRDQGQLKSSSTSGGRSLSVGYSDNKIGESSKFNNTSYEHDRPAEETSGEPVRTSSRGYWRKPSDGNSTKDPGDKTAHNKYSGHRLRDNKDQYDRQSKEASAPNTNDRGRGHIHLLLTFWIVLGIFVIVAAIEIFATIMLLKATSTSTEANDCYRKCKIYIIISSIIFVLYIIGASIFTAKILTIPFIIGVMLRAIFIFVGYQFMLEIQPYRSS